jgi:hypothetical protein
MCDYKPMPYSATLQNMATTVPDLTMPGVTEPVEKRLETVLS